MTDLCNRGGHRSRALLLFSMAGLLVGLASACSSPAPKQSNGVLTGDSLCATFLTASPAAQREAVLSMLEQQFGTDAEPASTVAHAASITLEECRGDPRVVVFALPLYQHLSAPPGTPAASPSAAPNRYIVTWTASGRLARAAYVATATSDGESEIKYDNSSTTEFYLTIVEASDHKMIPDDVIQFSDGSFCMPEVHGIPNDANVLPGDQAAWSMGCVPPGLYSLVSIDFADTQTSKIPAMAWHFASLRVPFSSVWTGACVRQGRPSDYPGVKLTSC